MTGWKSLLKRSYPEGSGVGQKAPLKCAKKAKPAVTLLGCTVLKPRSNPFQYQSLTHMEDHMSKTYWVSTYRAVNDAEKLAAHDSPAYQAALAALGDGADRDIRIIEGM
jgi:hypothetical protein